MTNNKNLDAMIAQIEKQALKDAAASREAVAAAEAEIEAIVSGDIPSGPTPEFIEARWLKGEDVSSIEYACAVIEHRGHLLGYTNAAGGKVPVAKTKANVLKEGAERRLKAAERKIVHVDPTIAEMVAEGFTEMFPGMTVRTVSGPVGALRGLSEADMPLVAVGPASAVSGASNVVLARDANNFDARYGNDGRVEVLVFRPVYVTYDEEDIEAALRGLFDARMINVAASGSRSVSTGAGGTQIAIRHKNKGQWGNDGKQVGGFVVDEITIEVEALSRISEAA